MIGEVRDKVFVYVKGIGGVRVGVLEMIFKEEIEIDLFGE